MLHTFTDHEGTTFAMMTTAIALMQLDAEGDVAFTLAGDSKPIYGPLSVEKFNTLAAELGMAVFTNSCEPKYKDDSRRILYSAFRLAEVQAFLMVTDGTTTATNVMIAGGGKCSLEMPINEFARLVDPDFNEEMSAGDHIAKSTLALEDHMGANPEVALLRALLSSRG